MLCLGSGLGCVPPLLAGVSGFVSACVRAPLAPRHSCLGCAVWVWVFELGSRLRPATPGWGVVVCVFVCVLPLSPPLLAGARGVGVCVLVRGSAAPRHSWLGCWGVCVMVWALPLYPATPGWGLRCGCVCLGRIVFLHTKTRHSLKKESEDLNKRTPEALPSHDEAPPPPQVMCMGVPKPDARVTNSGFPWPIGQNAQGRAKTNLH